MLLGDIPVNTAICIKSTSSDLNYMEFNSKVQYIFDETTILIEGLKNDENKYYKFDNWKNELIVRPNEREGLTGTPVVYDIDKIDLVIYKKKIYNRIICHKQSRKYNSRKAFRLNATAEVQLQLDAGKPAYIGTLKDIAYTGIGFNTNLGTGYVPLTLDKLQINAPILLGITFPNRPCYHVKATIKRIKPSEDNTAAFIGCQFNYENLNINREIQKIQAQRVRTQNK